MNIKIKRFSILFLLFNLMVAMSWIGNLGVSKAEARPIIVASIVPEASFIQEVAGDLVTVVTLIPPGANHETYEMSPQDLMQFSQANLYLTMALPLEKARWIAKASEINPGLKIVDVQDEVAKVYPPLYFSPEDRDPHIWISPKRSKVIVNVIAEQLSAIDPINQSTYEANAARFVARIDEADRMIQDSFKVLWNRTFIVYHPSLGYFAQDYGLTMVALEEEGKEATPRRLTEVIDLAKAKGIKIVFYQEEMDSKQARVLADEIGGQVQEVGEMSSDYIATWQKMAATFTAAMK
jgi:zinc transport system substrate-binding protein